MDKLRAERVSRQMRPTRTAAVYYEASKLDIVSEAQMYITLSKSYLFVS